MGRFIALCAALLVSGCATIINGSTESVSVTTDPIVGATCTLKNSEGTWYITTPGSTVISKTKNDLDVACTKNGYPDIAQTIPSKFQVATFGNIIAGGIIGIGVDAATGANFEYESPIKLSFATPPGDTSQPAATENAAPAQAATGAPAATTSATASVAVSTPKATQ